LFGHNLEYFVLFAIQRTVHRDIFL